MQTDVQIGFVTPATTEKQEIDLDSKEMDDISVNIHLSKVLIMPIEQMIL